MPSSTLQLSPLEYQRANQLVFSKALKQQAGKPLARALLAAVSLLYTGALFIIATAPNNLDSQTLRLLRGSAVALVVAPLLFMLVLALDRRHRLHASVAALPPPPETVHLAAEQEGLFVVTPGVRTEYQWNTVSLVVESIDFAALALPRAAPIPLPARAFGSSEQYLELLRSIQDLSRQGAA